MLEGQTEQLHADSDAAYERGVEHAYEHHWIAPLAAKSMSVAIFSQEPRGGDDMSKGMDRKKEGLKKPQKTLKEKRAEKRAKKAGGGGWSPSGGPGAP
jgi:hypothetical protein